MTDSPVLFFWFVLSNVAILAGYLFMGVVVAPRIRLRYRFTKVGGVWFFLLCGLTHASLAWLTLYPAHPGHGVAAESMATSPFMVLTHVAQAVAVWVFVIGLYVELGRFGGLDAGSPAVPPPEAPAE